VTVFGWDGLEGLWVANRGPRDKSPIAAGVALAESSGESGVVSSAGAIGCWQIMPFWAPHFGWPVSALYNPNYNARAAIAISSDGTNWGAWDTCYNPVSSAANRRDLPYPMAGSPAWNEIRDHGATVQPGTSPGVTGGPSASDRELLRRVAWANHLQSNAIPHNTSWVAYNRRFHYPHRRPTIV
jgi:hypothetical protein